jgi:hypothetical protein
MRGSIVRWAVLCSLAPALSGCVFIYFGYLASIPAPRTSIDVTWAADQQVCTDAIEGRPGHMAFVGLELHHFSRVSDRNFTERRYEVWKAPTNDASFTDFGSLGRGVFDFDNDGTLDLIYVEADSVMVGPATAAARNGFESQRTSKQLLAALGFQVYDRQDWLKEMSPATRVELQRVDGVTYLLATLPDIPFDARRPSAPKYTPLWDSQEPTDNTAQPKELYRVQSGGATHKVCSFLMQTTAYAIGGL